MTYESPHGIEQSRRDFAAREPVLYAYMAHVEAAKALDSAGDAASGATDGHGAANRVWRMAAARREQARILHTAGATS